MGVNSMSGHSKFANIKHRKAKNDAVRGKIFTKIGRELVVAVKSGGPDPAMNTSLFDIISKAKANNMPNDTITRAIKKASGESSDVNYDYIAYEGYGPNGVAVIVECLTDNKNRTAANIRHGFAKYGGNMGTLGCVSFMFDKKGQIIVEKSDDIKEDDLMMLALDVGAEDFISEEEGYEIITLPEDYTAVHEALLAANIVMLSSEVTMIPQTTVSLSDEEAENLEKMIDHLEEDDDVQNVYHNWDS
jgi:YebC/PmpR family DNA-binding regulatory protein